jgi:predicted ATP-grasp superfamily ATP-dependent carboligase
VSPTLRPPQPARAIVTDGLWRKSLSAIRSLGRAGFDVTVMGDSFFTTGFWSGYATGRAIAPSAASDPDAFGKRLLKLVGEHPGAVLLPMEDATLKWVSDHREELEGKARFLIPSRESLEIALDKRLTLQVAARLGLPCPRTWEPEDAPEFARLASGLEPGTFVVKPRSGTGSAGLVYGEKLAATDWEAHWRRFGPMLLQERIPEQGRGLGVSALMDQDGRCVATFAHERLQQYPNSGGPSTDRRSIHAPELVERSLELLRRLEWRGIAMVEWKTDPRDNQPKLMEINPRFWGSLELAVRSCVDFPLLYARAALGERSQPVTSYVVGRRCRWMIPGEILRYLTQAPARREGIIEFLRGLPALAEEWDPRDLLGTLATLVCTAGLALNPRYWKYVRRG